MIKSGDYITRNSYKNDTLFLVLSVKGNMVYLKGVNDRLYADSPVDDCTIVDKEVIEDKFNVPKVDTDMDRNDYFYLPPRVLQLDGDSDYLKRCMNFYKEMNVKANGLTVSEIEIPRKIHGLLDEFQPDIVVITGHDAYLKKNRGDYQNSLNFIEAVREARKYEKSQDKLIIIAGACQSNYEELIKAGANFASSPKRVNIHALDPAIIACNLALTERNKEINLIELLSKTKNGVDGMGGLICNGMMYVGYPR